MGWWAKMRELWPFGTVAGGGEASAAVQQAEQSRREAALDRERAVQLRQQVDAATDAVRAHNAANRYDDFLRRVIQDRE